MERIQEKVNLLSRSSSDDRASVSKNIISKILENIEANELTKTALSHVDIFQFLPHFTAAQTFIDFDEHAVGKWFNNFQASTVHDLIMNFGFDSEEPNVAFSKIPFPLPFVAFVFDLFDRYKPPKTRSFLNVGCGTGYVNYIASYFFGDLVTNVGLETDYEDIVNTLYRAGEINVCYPNIQNRIFPTFRYCHVTELEPGAKFDAILCACITTIEDKQNLIPLLADGGVLINIFERVQIDDENEKSLKVSVNLKNGTEINVIPNIQFPEHIMTLFNRVAESDISVQKPIGSQFVVSPPSLSDLSANQINRSLMKLSRVGLPNDDDSAIAMDWDSIVIQNNPSTIKNMRKVINKMIIDILSIHIQDDGDPMTLMSNNSTAEMVKQRVIDRSKEFRNLANELNIPTSYQTNQSAPFEVTDVFMNLVAFVRENMNFSKNSSLEDINNSKKTIIKHLQIVDNILLIKNNAWMHYLRHLFSLKYFDKPIPVVLMDQLLLSVHKCVC